MFTRAHCILYSGKFHLIVFLVIPRQYFLHSIVNNTMETKCIVYLMPYCIVLPVTDFTLSTGLLMDKSEPRIWELAYGRRLFFGIRYISPFFFSPFHVRLLRETDNPTIRSVNNWATRNSRNSVLGVMISQVRLNWWFVYLTYRSWKQPVFGKLSYVRPSEMFSFNYLILIYTFHSLVCTYYQSSLLLSFS